VLFGVRYDLDLSRRWWHRLFRVVFVLTLVAVGTVTWLLVQADDPQPTTSNTSITEDLPNYIRTHPGQFPPTGRVLTGTFILDGVNGGPPSVGTVGRDGKLVERPARESDLAFDSKSPPLVDGVAEFIRLRGELGIRGKDGSLKRISDFDLKEAVCRYPAQQLGSGPPRFSSFDGRPLFRVANTPGDEPQQGYCDVPDKIGVTSADSIIKWHYRPGVVPMHQAKTIALGLLLVALPLTNLYYRGLIYIVFGGAPNGRATRDIASSKAS
jgi:hypothetical protein